MGERKGELRENSTVIKRNHPWFLKVPKRKGERITFRSGGRKGKGEKKSLAGMGEEADFPDKGRERMDLSNETIN